MSTSYSIPRPCEGCGMPKCIDTECIATEECKTRNRARRHLNVALLGQTSPAPQECPYGDPACPCQDVIDGKRDPCHYEGPDAWPDPVKGRLHPS
jgi:hypothetical protein